MVRRPRLEPHVHVRSIGIADQLAVERLRRSAGVHVIDPLPGPVREPGLLERIRVLVAVAVSEPEVEQLLAHRPRHRLVDPLMSADRLLRVVEARGLVEIAGEEDRVPLVEQPAHRLDRPLQRRRPDLVFGLDHRRHGVAVAKRPRAPIDVIQMLVEERDHVTRSHLDQPVEPVSAGGLVDRVLREQLQRHVVVRVARVARDLREPVVGLEHADDVGVHLPHHAVGVRPAPVLDVVDEQVELNRLSGRTRGRSGRRLGLRISAAEVARTKGQGRG